MCSMRLEDALDDAGEDHIAGRCLVREGRHEQRDFLLAAGDAVLRKLRS